MACDFPYPSEPCHYGKHRGMGGKSAGWEPQEWVPLCRRCHDRLDKRNGASDTARYLHDVTVALIEKARPAWLRRWTQ
jgi:hypothetical protein